LKKNIVKNREVIEMLLRKFMSLLGVGSATIDLILPKDTYYPGEIINGIYKIKGGTIDQKIKRIDCDLVMKNVRTGNEKVIDSTMVLLSQQIQSEEDNQLNFSFKLDDQLPYSSEEWSFRFKTRLTFNEGVESKDQDIIQILPK
jgi:sporulation-control protein